MDPLFGRNSADHGGDSTLSRGTGPAEGPSAHDVSQYTKNGKESLAVTWAATAQLAARVCPARPGGDGEATSGRLHHQGRVHLGGQLGPAVVTSVHRLPVPEGE